MISIIVVVRDKKDLEKLHSIKRSIKECELIIVTNMVLENTFADSIINLKKYNLNFLLKYLLCNAKYDKVLIIKDLNATDYVGIKKVVRSLNKYDVFIDLNPDSVLNRIFHKIGIYILAWRNFIAINKSSIKDLLFLSSLNLHLVLLCTDRVLNITGLFNLNSVIFLINSLIALPKLSIKFLDTILQYNVVRDYFNEKIGILMFKLFAFFLTISLARILGVEGYGTYIIVLSFSFLLSSFLDLGTPIAIIRYFNEETDIKKHSQYVKIFVLMVLTVNLLAVLTILPLQDSIAEYFLKNKNLGYLFIFSPLISMILIISNVFRAILHAYGRFDVIRKVTMFEGFLKFVIITTLSYFTGVVGAILGFIIAYLILSIVLLCYINKLFPHLFSKQEFIAIDIMSTIKYLFSLNIVSAARSIYLWTDSLLVGYLLDPKSVGYYNAAASITSTIISLINPYTVFGPRIASWSINKIRMFLPRMILISLAISLPVFLFVVIFSKHIVIIIYGEEYAYAMYLVRVRSFLIILNAFAYFGLIFNLKGKPEYSAISIVSGTISNIIADILLIKMFGLVGAVIATILAQITEIATGYLLYKYRMLPKYS